VVAVEATAEEDVGVVDGGGMLGETIPVGLPGTLRFTWEVKLACKKNG
jgi:hypothetical protein